MAKLLVVDDFKDLLDFFVLLFKHEHHTVLPASTRKKALDWLTFFTPDVILLDVMLNGEDGREICREMKRRKELEHIPIILMSASPKLLEGYESYGAFDALEKPFEMDILLERIELAIQYQRIY